MWTPVSSGVSQAITGPSGAPTVTVTDFGTSATKAVIESYVPAATTLTALGLTSPEGVDPLVVLQMDRLTDAGAVVSAVAMTFTLPFTGSFPLTVYTFNSSSTGGTDITLEGGSITLDGSQYTIRVPHTSVITAYNSSAVSPSPAATTDDDSDDSLWGLFGLLALPVVFGAVGYAMWVKKKYGPPKGFTLPGSAYYYPPNPYMAPGSPPQYTLPLYTAPYAPVPMPPPPMGLAPTRVTSPSPTPCQVRNFPKL